MNPTAIVGWLQRAKQRLWKSSGAPRTARRQGERRLMLESLEGRELMAVATLDRTWKEFDFASPVPVAVNGYFSGKYGTQSLNGKFNGNLSLDGQLQYTSSADGLGEGTAVGALNRYIFGYGNLPVLNVNSTTGPGGVKEQAGKFSAILPPSGDLGGVTLTGSVNTRDWSASGSIKFSLSQTDNSGKTLTINANGTWKGSIPPTTPEPLDVSLTAQWDDAGKFGTVDVNVTAGGSVQKALTRTTPVAVVSMYWGDDAGNRLTKLKDTIPVLWNQATGSYEVSKLPVPPLAATKLIFVTTYGATVKTTLLDLPARPTVSIDSIVVTSPAVGTTDAVFTVTLSSNTLAPVKFKFATVDGTAVKGSDYTKKLGVLTFKPGGPLTQTITIKVKNDNAPGPESFAVQLSPPAWGTIDGAGTGTATINDPPPATP